MIGKWEDRQLDTYKPTIVMFGEILNNNVAYNLLFCIEKYPFGVDVEVKFNSRFPSSTIVPAGKSKWFYNVDKLHYRSNISEAVFETLFQGKRGDIDLIDGWITQFESVHRTLKTPIVSTVTNGYVDTIFITKATEKSIHFMRTHEGFLQWS